MLSLAVGRVVLPSTPRLFTRAYVVSIEPPVVYPSKPTPRRYGERKTFLYNQYTRMLKASENAPIIFLQHKDFTARRLQTLRREVDLANSRFTPSLDSATPTPVADPPKLSIMRTSIFGVALRDFAPLDAEKTTQIAKLVDGGFAVLTLSSLSPPQLNAIIRAMDRAVPPKKAQTNEVEVKPKKGKEEDVDFVPGRPVPRVRPTLTPELKVLGAVIEGRVFSAAGVADVAKLPTLDTLRAQIVGLLSSPAMQLAVILSEASGGKLARTLEGLKKGLEEGQSAEAPPS
jgi:ribosomal protein L10